MEHFQRQNLTCLNAHELCQGSITRHRKTVLGDEKAILDFVIVCDQLVAHFQRMIIDEKRANILTKYVSLKGVRVKSESDHNPLFVEFSLKFSRTQTVRREIFDFKDEESLNKFTELTSNSEKLSTCFESGLSPKAASDKFYKSLNDTFHRAFKKIRIRLFKPFCISKRDNIEDQLRIKSDLEKVVRSSKSQIECEEAKLKLQRVDLQIYEIMSEKNAKIISEQVASLDTMDGSFSQIGMWKVKKKLFSRPKEPPTAKKDEHGNLITAPSALKNLYLITYKNRLEHRKMKECYHDIRKLKSDLWELRFESLKTKPSKPWTIEDLEEATKSLKK